MLYPGVYIRELISRGLITRSFIWGNISGELYSLAYIKGTYIWGRISGGLYPGDLYLGGLYLGAYIRGLIFHTDILIQNK